MKPCSWYHINLMTGCCLSYLVFSVHSESRKILGSGSRGGGEWMRSGALRARTRRFIRCFSRVPVTLRAVFLGRNLSKDTHKIGGQRGHYVKFGTGVNSSHPMPALFASIDPDARRQLQPATQPELGTGAGGGFDQRGPQPQLPKTERVSTNGS